ncbi:MAG: hypothetical protein F4X81_11960 [Gammaproteobacteria bacterium]|nr:hypothetical protein [Gammaproteobacteria bacterium]MDD9963272.1 hypothetical protein [Gammaproteobacteria bacterium]MXY05150.1 hypothetical protein [Gammaproteobacteria bacterium]MYE52168.1 hypothetical protein [Gammaproteobacteria bacterium]MYF49807.1 hypothetical protein [Gammaproteobacteria bacterium]
MKFAKTLAVLAFLALMPALDGAAQQRPPWMQPDVVRAAVDIGMTDEQLAQFRSHVAEFMDGRMKAFNNLMRRNNVTNMDRKMKSRTNKLKRRMDEQMSELLTEEQYPKYEVYRDLLMSKFRI